MSKYLYMNEDVILATINDSNNPMEGVRVLVDSIKSFRSERDAALARADALAKRVEELEETVADWIAFGERAVATDKRVQELEGLLRTVEPVLRRYHETECATYVWKLNACGGCEVADILAMIGEKP